MEKTIYRSHPYHAPQEGNPRVLRLLTLDTLNAFVDRRYVPNRTVLAVVGDITNAAVVQQVTQALGSLPSVPVKARVVEWHPVGGEKELNLGAGSNLAWIFLGYPAANMVSPDYAAMRTMHALLGEGVSSRLWVNLREDHGLAYELGSIYPVLQGPSHFLAYLITTPKQLEEARRRMFAEIDRLRNEDVPEEKLVQARWKVIGETLSQEETSSGKAFSLASYEVLGAGYDFSDRFLDNVRKVTPADIRRVANTYLTDYTLIVARPPSN